MYNFFDAPQPVDTRELIPIGTPLFVEMTYTPGGHGENGLLTKSKPTPDKPNPDTAYLKAEFTILRGPYKNRKFWSNFTLEGGERDEKGNSKAAAISYQTLRKIIYSAHGLKSDDMTPNAKTICERYSDLKALNGIRFVCRAGVSKEQPGYPQKNELGGHWNIMTIDSKRWPSEHELDNPPKDAKAAAPAPNAPVWGAQPGNPTPPAQGNGNGSAASPAFAGSPSTAAPPTTFGGTAAAPQADVAVAAAKAAEGVPKWMLNA